MQHPRLATRLPVILAAVCALAALLPAGFARAQAPQKLVVGDLRSQGMDTQTVATLTDVLCTHIANTQKSLSVLCTDDVRTILAARDTALRLGSGDEKQEQAYLVDIGNALKARYVLSGSIGRVGAKVVFNFSILDVEASRSFARASYTATDGEDKKADLIAAIKAAADMLFAKPEK